MYCTKCGTKNDDDSIWCGNCGERMPLPGDIPEKAAADDISYEPPKLVPEVIVQDDKARCPNCGSSQIQPITEEKGCCGPRSFGPLGMLLGLFGKGKKNKRICMKCGKQY